MKCNNCGHEWISRIEKPKACPKCKRYDYQDVVVEVKKKKKTKGS